MKLVLSILLSVMLSVSVMAQQKIQFRSTDRVECAKSDMTSLKASFSFSTIEAEDYSSDRGTFSWLSLPNTVLGGNEGDPQIPVINQLIAVPFGATPRIEVTSYSSTDYNLADYDMKTLVPRQLPVRKNQKPEDVPFIMNEAAYQTRGLRSEPKAVVGIEGIMRGVQLGKMTIEPVSYDPVNNTIRVFNDLEVTVHFDGADAAATEQMLLDTYSPYFDIVYKQLFNGRAIMDAYSDHPDLYDTPVKMLVVTTSDYQSSTAYQNWLTWKKQKGIEVDEYIVTSSTASSTIRSGIQTRYNQNHPTFLVIVGDESVVKNYTTYNVSGNSYNPYISDNPYASIDSDVYHDMYMSRMSVSNTTQLGYLVDKILMYEKYTMPDPSYLNNSLLVAGWDSYWTQYVGKPTIQYATTNYYNTAHGITATAVYTTRTGQTSAYNNINNVGFLNYTAHGDIQELADPEFTNSNANSMTNSNKPMWIVANCCLTANWGNSSYSPCLGETMIRANNKGTFGYIGSVPESLWYEDYYFGVGAFNYQGESTTVQTVSGTTTGMYDALFDDTGFNTLNSVPYIGNVAVTYAHAKGYESSVSDEYYWRGYQCLGDGSVMPYLKVPAANNVSHASSLQIGSTSFVVNADARSYVSITVNNEIIGVAAVPANATSVSVPITAQTTTGTAMIVVTRNQRQPYITTIPIEGGTQYTISASANPTAGGTVQGAGQYYGSSECTLTATANRGYVFANWTLNGNEVSTNPTYTFTVNSDATYVANFTALTLHSLTYTPQQEHGTISVSPNSAYMGETVTLSATPEATYHLDHWDVNTVSKGNVPVVNNQFTMPDSDVTISATFRAGYAVTVPYLIGGTITPSANTAEAGDVIRLSVTPNSPYSFLSWNVYETGNPSNTVTVTNDSFTMPAYDVTVSAVFGTATQVEVETTVNVGSGTSTTNGNYVPTYSARNNAQYSVTEQIYTASEMGDAGKITAIEFYNSGTARTRTIQVYMVHTSNSNFSSTTAWIHPTSSNLVYSGSVNFASRTWTTITFTTPFEYDGRSNVALIVDDNTGANGNSMSFYTYSGSNNQVIRYGGNSNYDPTNITATASGRQANKNVLHVHKIVTENQVLPLVCDAAPTNLTVEAAPNSAIVSWEGDADSYNIRYRLSAPKFTYDFESADQWAVDAFSPCTTYDGDATQTYGVDGIDFDNEGYTGSFIAAQNGLSDNWAAHSGNAFGACIAANGATNNDWFILPSMTIENGDVFGFWARSLTESYGLERIKVGVYRASGAFSSYLAGSASAYVEVPTTWTNYSYDLSAYAGQTIQLAINCVSNDAFALFIDDISITNAGGSWDQTITNVTSPYTIEGLDQETLYEVQVVGVCDGIGESAGVGATFTTKSWCDAPTPTSITNIAASSADLGWTGYQESYNVRYRTAGGRETLFYENFGAALSGWTTSSLGSNSGLDEGMFVFARNGSNYSQTVQYLISPEINITESGCYLVYYHVGYNGTATIQIGYSSRTNATSDFTWGTSQTVAQGTSFSQYYEEIPTGTKYIGIRVNSISSSSAYYILTDFMVLGPYVEPGEYHYANNVTSPAHITGLDPETEYEWQVQGVDCDGNGTPTDWSSEAYFVTPSACDAPSGLTTSDITATSATLSWAQSLDNYNLRYGTPETKFSYDFESASPYAVDDFSPCTTYDGDGSTTGAIQDVTFDNQNYTGSFIAFQSGVATGLNAHGGNAFGACFYATTPANNDFFILPSIAIETGDVFSFWAMGYSSSYPESFKVGIYNGNGGIRTYLAGSASASITPSTSWQQYSYDLSAYNGQTIQLAIQCVSNDAFIFGIDDIFVGNPHWSNPISVSGASHTLENLNQATEYSWQVQGVDCDGNGGTTDWSGSATFTTGIAKHIEAYTSDNDGWYLIASPIGTVSATDVINMIPSTAADYDLYSFNQAAHREEWQNYKQGRFTNLETGHGYLYANANDVDLIFFGTPYSGDGTFTLVYSEDNEDVNMRGWNLMGNPFFENATIDRSFYVMNNGGEIIAADRNYIEPMEGIFVIAESDGENLVFSTTSKKAAASELVMNVSSNQGKLIDRAIVNFDETSTLPKFQLHENSTKLYIPQDGKDFAVVHSEGMGETPVSFKPENNGIYTISVNAKNVEVSYLHLIDNLTGDDIDLLKTQTYTFNSRITDYASRFKLVYIIGQIASDDFFAFNNNGNWIISNEGEATLQMIDVNGHILLSEHISGTVTKHIEAASGVYILRLINGTDEKTQKIVVK